MTVNLQVQRATEPTLFVTKGRQRVKQYGNTIYLKNGDEFELELFNPTQSKVLAKINLNGKSLGSGIIIRPGERVFLERYLDEARKFLFETYEVDGSDSNVKEAIKNNGEVEVQFFEEYKPNNYWQSPFPQYTYYNTGIRDSQIMYGSARSSSIGQTTNNCGGISSSASYTTNSCSCDNVSASNFSRDFAPQETGRVEKGSDSNQNFTYDNTQFNSYSSWRASWKILPESQRPLMAKDLKIFCTSCGSKRKKSSHSFCPKCGNKF